jgi:hypothetical protein
MATVGQNAHDWGIKEPGHPVLFKAFSAGERQRLIEDDLFAGRSVSLLLVVVVGLGLLIGAIAVLTTL